MTLRQSLNDADRLRIRQLASFVRAQETASLLAILAPQLKPAQRAAVACTCSFTHAGLLIFPADLSAAIAELPGLGVTPGPLVPSVVIRQRLAGRCAPAAGPQVWITHAAVTGACGRDLELFLAPGNEPALAAIARDERASNHESHFALEGTGSPAEMAQVREILAGAGKLLADGGGYNPHENPASGGRTVLYFRAPDQTTLPWPPRTELILDGHHPRLLAIHQQTPDRPAQGSPGRPATPRPDRPGDGGTHEASEPEQPPIRTAGNPRCRAARHAADMPHRSGPTPHPLLTARARVLPPGH